MSGLGRFGRQDRCRRLLSFSPLQKALHTLFLLHMPLDLLQAEDQLAAKKQGNSYEDPGKSGQHEFDVFSWWPACQSRLPQEVRAADPARHAEQSSEKVDEKPKSLRLHVSDDRCVKKDGLAPL